MPTRLEVTSPFWRYVNTERKYFALYKAIDYIKSKTRWRRRIVNGFSVINKQTLDPIVG
jgi:hypothetical protein